ncbi:MAG: hypothetical protein IK082_12320 [Oscillospiraceae bacterium]|nr:hypothetical protein [Oscillospiraceae bacterium]
MSKEIAKKFLMEYAANPEAMKLLNEYPQPETLGDGAKILSEIAGKLGIAFTAEEMAEAIGEAEAARKARTDAAAGDLAALPDDELGEIAGGGKTNSSCSENYMRTNSCWSDYYCYGIYHGAPDDRRDVPCAFDYNCFDFYYAESCEQNYFYQRSICKSNQD